jgi:hypothetical protein
MNTFVFAFSALLVAANSLDSSVSTGQAALHTALKQLQNEYKHVQAIGSKAASPVDDDEFATIEDTLAEASVEPPLPAVTLKSQQNNDVVLKSGAKDEPFGVRGGDF